MAGVKNTFAAGAGSGRPHDRVTRRMDVPRTRATHPCAAHRPSRAFGISRLRAAATERHRRPERPATDRAVLDVLDAVLVAGARIEAQFQRLAAPGTVAVAERAQVHPPAPAGRGGGPCGRYDAPGTAPERGPRCNDPRSPPPCSRSRCSPPATPTATRPPRAA